MVATCRRPHWCTQLSCAFKRGCQCCVVTHKKVHGQEAFPKRLSRGEPPEDGGRSAITPAQSNEDANTQAGHVVNKRSDLWQQGIGAGHFPHAHARVYRACPTRCCLDPVKPTRLGHCTGAQGREHGPGADDLALRAQARHCAGEDSGTKQVQPCAVPRPWHSVRSVENIACIVYVVYVAYVRNRKAHRISACTCVPARSCTRAQVCTRGVMRARARARISMLRAREPLHVEVKPRTRQLLCDDAGTWAKTRTCEPPHVVSKQSGRRRARGWGKEGTPARRTCRVSEQVVTCWHSSNRTFTS